jgi:hypothetical protein
MRGSIGNSIQGLGLARPHRRCQVEKLVMGEAHRQLDQEIGPGFQFDQRQTSTDNDDDIYRCNATASSP